MLWLQDLHFALRQLRNKPVFAIVATLSLGLGIAATTAGFALFDGLLLNPLPALHAPEDLVLLRASDTTKPERLRPLSFANYLDYARSAENLAALAASADCDLTLSGDRPAVRLKGSAVSVSFFTTLGITPTHGRLFAPGDEEGQLAVLSHHFWQREFGGDPGVLGSTLTINGLSFTVIGVAAAKFTGLDLTDRRDVYLPLGTYSSVVKGVMVPFSGQTDRQQQWLDVVGRLAPGIGLRQASQGFAVLAENLAVAYPETNAERRLRVMPLEDQVFGEGRRASLESFVARFVAIMTLVLIAATVNVAGLLLARGMARRQEFALRASLGCGRAQLLRQLFVEGLCLALLGAVAGTVLAWLAIPLFDRLLLPVDLRALALAPSPRILGAAALGAVASSLIFSFFPLAAALRLDLVAALRGEAARSRRRRFGARELLAGVQVGMALLVLLAAGLMLRTVAQLRSIPVGFDPARVLVASVDLAPAGYEGPAVDAFYSELMERLRALPGVREASMASAIPLMGGEMMVDLGVTPEGADPATGQQGMRHALVGTGFFRTVGIELLEGRDFESRDTAASLGVVVLNEAGARLLWPEGSAVGRRLFLLQSETPFEVIGVVADTAYGALVEEERPPVVYLAHAQASKSFIGNLLAPGMSLLVRTEEEPRGLVALIRGLVREMDPRLPVHRVATLAGLLAKETGIERQAAVLYGTLAIVAVAMSLLGLYGLLMQLVLERTRELGVRIALGARPGDLHGLVLRRSLTVTLAGLALGVAAGLAGGKLIASQLYGVEATDPLTWTLAVGGMLTLALLTGSLPARRAARVEPVAALKSE